jgi:hypothetical protein
VHVNQWNCGDFYSSKAPTTILLKPDKSFYAFGYEAEAIFTHMAESHSDSEDEEEGRPKENCKDFYYFHRFKMLLRKVRVSQTCDENQCDWVSRLSLL